MLNLFDFTNVIGCNTANAHSEVVSLFDTIWTAAFYVLRAARKTIFIICCHVTSVGLAQFNSNMCWILFFQLPGTIHN